MENLKNLQEQGVNEGDQECCRVGIYPSKRAFSITHLILDLIQHAAIAETVRICKSYQNDPQIHKVCLDKYSFERGSPGDGLNHCTSSEESTKIIRHSRWGDTTRAFGYRRPSLCHREYRANLPTVPSGSTGRHLQPLENGNFFLRDLVEFKVP